MGAATIGIVEVAAARARAAGVVQGVDHIRLRGHELGGERRQPLQPVMSEAGLQRDGLPVNVTKLGEPRAHAIRWRIDVVRCSW